ncbi:DNRLRE domain-containing protein [Paenibacillus sp.]|uniref:CBM96 family carbohydrate-binding protein n=1 Tax=Paenibacillus sp. TaxID=58172 RepID=UPI002810C6D2|nr:DNRLRE domain-containing protein [Paenibacillus sp.]
MNRSATMRSRSRWLHSGLAILFLLGSLLSNAPARTEAAERLTAAFAPTEDTFAYRDSNQSASPTLVSRYNGGGYERVSYLKFDLADLAGMEVEQATFKVYLIRTEGMGDVGVFGLTDNDWSDDTVHLTNEDGTFRRPSEEGRTLLGRYPFNTSGTNAVGAWIEYDIAAYLNERLQDGATAATVMLKNFSYAESSATAGQGFAYYGSSKSANRPTIEAVYSEGGTAGGPPAKPTVVLAGIEPSPPTVTLKWPAAARAAHYTVSRAVYEEGAFAALDGALRSMEDGVYFDDATVQPNRVYGYKVTAYAEDGSSAESDVLIVTVPPFLGPGDETSASFAPTDDAYINQANENAYLNFGNRQEMIVRHNAAFWKRVGYVKFDLGSLVGVTDVRKATLKLYLRDVQSGGSMVGLYAIRDNAWSEADITAFDVPSEEGKELIGSVNALAGVPTNAWREVDVTPYIRQRFANHERELTIMLLGGLDAQRSQGYAYFGTKESPSGPGLTIDYVIPESVPPLEPPAPTVLEATGTNVTLGWPVVLGAAKYRVYRKAEGEAQFAPLNAGTYVENGTVYANDASVEFGTSYEYRVDAIGPGGDALSGEPVRASTPPLELAAPTGLTETLNKGNALALAWEAVPHATSYELYRSLQPEDGYALVAEVAETAFEDAGLALDVMYYYRLKAKRGRYESPMSEAVAMRTERYATAVFGRVALEGAAEHSGIVVRLSNDGREGKRAVTDGAGNFALYAVPPGTYDLVFTKAAYLKRISSDVAVAQADVDVGAQGELKLGDLNGDDRIDVLDLRLIAAAYGNRSSSVDFNPLLDLNRDGRIDRADVDRLLTHYRAETGRGD